MYKLVATFLMAIILTSGYSQQLSKASRQQLRKSEDTLKQWSKKMVFQTEAIDRFRADSFFIRSLVRALKTPHSFQYLFDSVETVSKIYAPDSSFRIFTWQFMKDESFYRQRGAIQMRTKDGSLKLFPLFDVSEFTEAPTDSIRTRNNWIGAIYYGIILKTHNNKKYYTLLGYDDNNFRSTRKWMEVLTFNENGEPQFGGPYFVYRADSTKPKQPAARFCLEYKKDGRARIIYEPEEDLILFDHLVSQTKELSKKYTLIPTGDLEAFRWTDGRWIHIPDFYANRPITESRPTPEPIRDANGKLDEEKLKKQSEKNAEKAAPKKPPVKKKEEDPLQKEY
jgi:hypothetical protein